MRIAVTFENDEVFQHFGHCEVFKLYDVENGEVVSKGLVKTAGSGHEAVAAFLADQDVDAVICGGIGPGAEEALYDSGIEICSGVSGNTDEAVDAYLHGELISEGVNCDHHGEDGCGGCGGDCGSGCGGCGGGCGGCGGGAPIIFLEGPNAGKRCKVHYKGTFNDGTQFDSSYDRGEPIEFICGAGMMIPGFDQAVVDMEVGQIVEVHIMPEDAYGMPDPSAIFTVNIADLPGSENLEVEQQVYLQNPMGQPFPVTVTAKDDATITFDANHEMAGKELNFTIELISAE